MIITITEVTQAFTKSGTEYLKVKGTTPDGKETTKSIFGNLKESWGLLEEGATLDFTMEKKEQFWNVIAIKEPALDKAILSKAPPLPQTSAIQQKILDKPPKETKEEAKEEAKKIQQTIKATIVDNKNRAFALSYAKDICCALIGQAKEMTPAKVIEIARIFEKYLNNEHNEL